MRERIERFRRESAIVRIGGEREMQFARALAEQLRLLRIDAADQFSEQGAGRNGRVLQIRLAAKNPLVEAADRVERQRPGVAFVRRGSLQQADNRRFTFGAAIFDRARERRDVREVPLRQERRHFHIRIHAVFQLAVELQEKFVLEEHGGIALLRDQDLRSRNHGFTGERGTGNAAQLARFSIPTRPLHDRAEKLLAKSGVPDRVVQNRVLCAGEPRDDGMRRGLRHGVGRLASSRSAPERIGLGIAIEIGNFDEPELRAAF